MSSTTNVMRLPDGYAYTVFAYTCILHSVWNQHEIWNVVCGVEQSMNVDSFVGNVFECQNSLEFFSHRLQI